jgi:carbonic anhydrase/acetyltransferase-like protein (isoleucine patch superfamily)
MRSAVITRKVSFWGHCEGAVATAAISQLLRRAVVGKNGEIATLPLVARNDQVRGTFISMGAPAGFAVRASPASDDASQTAVHPNRSKAMTRQGR